MNGILVSEEANILFHWNIIALVNFPGLYAKLFMLCSVLKLQCISAKQNFKICTLTWTVLFLILPRWIAKPKKYIIKTQLMLLSPNFVLSLIIQFLLTPSQFVTPAWNLGHLSISPWFFLRYQSPSPLHTQPENIWALSLSTSFSLWSQIVYASIQVQALTSHMTLFWACYLVFFRILLCKNEW